MENENYSEAEFSELMSNVLADPESFQEESEANFQDISPLEHSDYLTTDKGLVIDLQNGQRFLVRVQMI